MESSVMLIKCGKHREGLALITASIKLPEVFGDKESFLLNALLELLHLSMYSSFPKVELVHIFVTYYVPNLRKQRKINETWYQDYSLEELLDIVEINIYCRIQNDLYNLGFDDSSFLDLDEELIIINLAKDLIE